MFLHYILTRTEEALIKRAFWAQVHKPVKEDWCLVVKEDLLAMGLGYLSYEDIEAIKTESLKTFVKSNFHGSLILAVKPSQD